MEDGEGENAEVLAPAPESEGPEAAVETAQAGAILRNALSTLDDETRMLILLCDVEGLSYEEMSRTSGLPLGTVKSRIHRARGALRKILVPALAK